jgi:hypothetical protein
MVLITVILTLVNPRFLPKVRTWEEKRGGTREKGGGRKRGILPFSLVVGEIPKRNRANFLVLEFLTLCEL